MASLRELEPGMVITVEPGLYIAPDDERGVRHAGAASASASRTTWSAPTTAPEVLTHGVPKDPDEIEAA